MLVPIQEVASMIGIVPLGRVNGKYIYLIVPVTDGRKNGQENKDNSVCRSI